MPVTTEQDALNKAKTAVRSDLASLNSFEIQAIPDELKSSGKTVRIFTVNPKLFAPVQLGSLGIFTLPVCPEGEEYGGPLEIPGIIPEGIPTDMRKIEHRMWSGKMVAQDVLGFGKFKNRDQDMRRWGFFIAEHETPSKKELAEANKQLKTRYTELCKEADKFWAMGPKGVENIGENHQEARLALGIDAPWGRGAVQETVACRVCQQPVHPLAIVHVGPGGCNAVLNEAAVIKEKLKGYEYLWQKEKTA